MKAAFIIICSNPPIFRVINEVIPLEGLTIDGEVFTDSGLGSWIGFYDWLRTSDKRLVGVRTWADLSEDPSLLSQLAQCDAIEVEEGEVRVWWSNVRTFDETESSDQDLGEHRLMVGLTGKPAMTFDITRLSEDEARVLVELARAKKP